MALMNRVEERMHPCFNSSVDSETVGYVSLTDSLTVEIGLRGLDDIDYFGRDSIVVKYFPQGYSVECRRPFQNQKVVYMELVPGLNIEYRE
jgi:hypothetical protein